MRKSIESRAESKAADDGVYWQRFNNLSEDTVYDSLKACMVNIEKYDKYLIHIARKQL